MSWIRSFLKLGDHNSVAVKDKVKLSRGWTQDSEELFLNSGRNYYRLRNKHYFVSVFLSACTEKTGKCDIVVILSC